MTGTWLALGFIIGVYAVAKEYAGSAALVVCVFLCSWLIGLRDQRLLRNSGILLIGLFLAILRFVVVPVPASEASQASGVVLALQDDDAETSGIVVLRDDGRLVGLAVREAEGVRVGDRVVWWGVYRGGKSTVAGVRVDGLYDIESVRAEQDTTFGFLSLSRTWVRQNVLRIVPEPSGSLASGILIGDDRGLAPSTREVLRRAGLSHLTAVSGWNVAVVTAVAEGILARISPWLWLRWLGSGIAVWSYAALTGLEPPVQRAAVMATLYLLARWRGWPREPISALGWTVVGLLVLRPELAHSLAFQLSGIATAALSAVRFEKRERLWRELLLIPFVVQLAVTPLLLLRFGTFSLVAPLANALVEPVVPWLMVAGLLALLGGLVDPVGVLLGIPAWLLGKWIVTVAEWLLRIPGASGTMLEPPEWSVFWFYALAATAWLARIDRGREGT